MTDLSFLWSRESLSVLAVRELIEELLEKSDRISIDGHGVYLGENPVADISFSIDDGEERWSIGIRKFPA
ncbi:MAG: hypothetical protein VW683_17340 [Betaproteobacteria bacterium]